MRLLTVLALALALPTHAHAGSDKVTICHLTSSATNPYNIISVSSSALSAHSKHGDFEPFTAYADADGDGYGDATGALSGLCTIPAGYVSDDTDCDDTVASTNPGATETEYNGADDDCDASTPDDDLDGDGFVLDEDCDDGDAGVRPDAVEVCNDVDDDCDGDADGGAIDASTWYADGDGDGFGNADDSADACDQPAGYVADDTDCDDADPAVNPAGIEVCNGVDDDCNGLADDDAVDASTWYADTDGDGFGNGSVTTAACDAPAGHVADPSDCADTNAAINPGATEVCNDLDDNCDGDVDGGAIDATTWYADDDADGYGDASDSADACDAPAGHVADATDCDDADAAVSPGEAEIEGNGIDDDCDEDSPDETAIVWNAADDFESASNPSSDAAWGYWLVQHGIYKRLPNMGTAFGTIAYWNWGGAASFFNITVYKNTSATSPAGSNCSTDWCVQPGALAMHPSGDVTVNTVVRFTAPVTGTYDIDATFSPIDRQSNSISVGIIRNSMATILHSGILTTYGTSSSYAGTLSLTAGERIEFLVNNNGNWVNDGTDLDATITLH